MNIINDSAIRWKLCLISWFPGGAHVISGWGPRDFRVGPTWFPGGAHVISGWGPRDFPWGRGKDSRKNHRSFDPHVELCDTAATALEESASACLHLRRGLTPHDAKMLCPHCKKNSSLENIETTFENVESKAIQSDIDYIFNFNKIISSKNSWGFKRETSFLLSFRRPSTRVGCQCGTVFHSPGPFPKRCGGCSQDL